MKLQEALNKPAKYYWAEQKDHRWEGYFKVGGLTYALQTSREASPGRLGDQWEIYFYSEEVKKDKRVYKDTVTGSGGEFVVFATVAIMFDDFVKKVKPKEIIFFSSDDEKSRHKLYSRFVKIAAQKYKYDYEVGKNYFELTKKEKK